MPVQHLKLTMAYWTTLQGHKHTHPTKVVLEIQYVGNMDVLNLIVLDKLKIVVLENWACLSNLI